MPIGALRSSFYPFPANVPSEGDTPANYLPRWQAVVIDLNTGLSALWYPAVWLWDVVCWGWRIFWLTREKRATLRWAYRMLEHDAFPRARRAVEEASTAPGFKRKTAWADFSHIVKERHEWAESSWRHLYAIHRVLNGYNTRPLSPADLHLLIELAYQHYRISPRGPHDADA